MRRCIGSADSIALTRRLINGITGNIIALMTSGAAMDGMSEREYSCHSGLSRGAIQTGGGGGSDSYLKARTALTVYQAQERQLAIQKKKGMLVDPARAEDLVFRAARQERDGWVTWPARV